MWLVGVLPRAGLRFVRPILSTAKSRQKYFGISEVSLDALLETEIERNHLVPQRGARDRHERGAGCDGREGALDDAQHFADGEVVWS
jgi:hypothetical protein